MRLLLDVYDAGWNRLGEGPVATLTGARVTRMLDGVGTISFDVPATDGRALALLGVRRRFALVAEYQGVLRELARGLVLRRSFNETTSGATYTFECADILAELRDANTLVGRKYSQQTISSVVGSLVGLVAGWTASIEPAVGARVVDARFDGVPVLTALLELCKNNGVHLRVGATGKVVEVGVFGAASPVRVMNAETASAGMAEDVELALTDSISAGEDAEDVVNWVVPLGAGEDAASLRLRRSTRTTPYPIETMVGPDGRTVWYIRDTASIAAYGQSQRVVKFDRIKPLSNSAADRVNAANALYDAGVAYLERMKEPLLSYGVSLVGVKTRLAPGDKLGLRYKGRVLRDGEAVDYVDIDGAFWMMEVSERFGVEAGAAVDVQIANIDRQDGDVAETVVEALETISLRGLSPAAGVSCRSYVYPREIAPGFACVVPVEFTDATTELLRVRVRLKTSGFRATNVQGAHRHLVAQRVGWSTIVPTTALQLRMFGDGNGIQSISSLFLPAVSDPNADLYTFGAAGAVEYGIQDDSVTPSTVQCWVNGINRTAALGGPWAPSGGAIDILLNVGLMTGYLENAAGGLYQEHRIEFRCLGGRGRAEVTVEVYEVLQTIDVS